MSHTMREHFKSSANLLNKNFKPDSVLEIGSNDGVFLKHFDKKKTIAVEPCGNFAKMTNDMGYKENIFSIKEFKPFLKSCIMS